MSRTVSGAKGKRLRLGNLRAANDSGLRVRCVVSGPGLSPVTSEEAILFAGDGWFRGVSPGLQQPSPTPLPPAAPTPSPTPSPTPPQPVTAIVSIGDVRFFPVDGSNVVKGTALATVSLSNANATIGNVTFVWEGRYRRSCSNCPSPTPTFATQSRSEWVSIAQSGLAGSYQDFTRWYVVDELLFGNSPTSRRIDMRRPNTGGLWPDNFWEIRCSVSVQYLLDGSAGVATGVSRTISFKEMWNGVDYPTTIASAPTTPVWDSSSTQPAVGHTASASAGDTAIVIQGTDMYRTSDGEEWEEVQAIGSGKYPYAIAGSAGKGFVAAGDFGVAWSLDGNTWTEASQNSAAAGGVLLKNHTSWACAANQSGFLLTGKKLIRAGSQSTGSWTAYYSPDGLNWTQAYVPNFPIGGSGGDSITPPFPFGCSDRFLVVRPSSGYGTTNKVYYSVNGSTWQEATVPNTPVAGWRTAIKAGSRYFVFGSGGKYAYSDNLSSWTSGDMPFPDEFRAASFSGGVLVVTGKSNYAAVCTDVSARAWRREVMPYDQHKNVVAAGSRFMAFGDGEVSLRNTVADPAPPPVANAPSAVLDLSATGRSLAIDLDWGEPSSSGGSEITSYTIQHRLAGGQWSAATSVSDAQTSTSIAVAAAGNYEVRVAAVNANGTGPFSTVTATVTAAPPAGAPTGLGAVGDPSGGYNYGGRAFRKVLLSWSAPSGTAPASYKVQFQYGTAGIWNDLPFGWGGRNNATLAMTGTTSAAFTFVTTMNSATASGIRPPLKFRVGSVSAGGAIAWGDPISFSTLKTSSPPTTTPPTPTPNPTATPAPTGVTSSYIGTVKGLPTAPAFTWHRFSIAWTPPAGATSFALQLYKERTKRWYPILSGDPSARALPVDVPGGDGTHFFAAASLSSGVFYMWNRYRGATCRLVPYNGKTPGTPSATFEMIAP